MIFTDAANTLRCLHMLLVWSSAQMLRLQDSLTENKRRVASPKWSRQSFIKAPSVQVNILCGMHMYVLHRQLGMFGVYCMTACWKIQHLSVNGNNSLARRSYMGCECLPSWSIKKYSGPLFPAIYVCSTPDCLGAYVFAWNYSSAKILYPKSHNFSKQTMALKSSCWLCLVDCFL